MSEEQATLHYDKCNKLKIFDYDDSPYMHITESLYNKIDKHLQKLDFYHKHKAYIGSKVLHDYTSINNELILVKLYRIDTDDLVEYKVKKDFLSTFEV